MKFDVFFTISGLGGAIEVPNNTNPVQSDSLAELLTALSSKLPNLPPSVELVGVRVHSVPDSVPPPA